MIMQLLIIFGLFTVCFDLTLIFMLLIKGMLR